CRRSVSRPERSPVSRGRVIARAPSGNRAPEDLRLAVGVPATLRVVGSTYLRRLWPLLAAQAVPLAPAVLVVALLLPGMGPVLVDGTVTLTDAPDTEIFVTGIVITVVLVCVAVTAGSVAVVGCGALLGRDVPLTEAWKRSLRRLPTLLLWAALIAALTVGAWKLWSNWWPPEELLSRTGTLLLGMAVVVFLLAVSSMALVVALVEDRGPFEAVGTAWELGTERRSAPMLFAVLAVVGATLRHEHTNPGQSAAGMGRTVSICWACPTGPVTSCRTVLVTPCPVGPKVTVVS